MNSTNPNLEVVYEEQLNKNLDVFNRLREFDEGQHCNTNEIAKKINEILRAGKDLEQEINRLKK